MSLGLPIGQRPADAFLDESILVADIAACPEGAADKRREGVAKTLED